MPAKRLTVSAGLLLFRRRTGNLEVFLAHPGGPFWTGRDLGAWTIPKGLLNAGEDPLAAACRELVEETGYAGDLEPVGTMVDCAYSTRLRHVFAARGVRRVAEPHPEEGEAPEVVLISLQAFREHLRGGRLTDVGPGYLALDRLGLL